MFFFAQIYEIGDNAFDVTGKSNSLPETVVLPNVEHIGKEAFKDQKATKIFELFSSLKEIEDGAFTDTSEIMAIRIHSFVPCKINKNAFVNMSENAVLYVPKNSKIIFEKTIPWSSFNVIEEIEPYENKKEDEITEVSDEIYLSRLKSISDSIKQVDRVYVQSLIEEISYNFLDVDNEEDYEEALRLIAFNRAFTPAIIPDLEYKLCGCWPNRYKLKLVNKAIIDTSTSPLLLSESLSVKSSDYHLVDDVKLPIQQAETLLNLPNTKTKEDSSVEVHFKEILKYLQNELSLARSSVKVAVSWFTNYALYKQIKELSENGVKIQIIINNDLINNGGYCLDLNKLIEANVEISLVEYPHLLHDKFCIIDDCVLINGSYNWTRFSENNYENISIFRNNKEIITMFIEEFEWIWNNAEYKCVVEMPETVSVHPEYDRSAFKQYITEELDAEARETSDDRDKITILQKASELNPEYFDKINPKAKETYKEAFSALQQSVTITKEVVAMVKDKPQPSTIKVSPAATTSFSNSQQTVTANNTVSKSNSTSTSVSAKPIVTKEDKAVVERIKASYLFMVLDVSGSMRDIYNAGHVYNITKKAVSAAFAVSDSKEISLWKFGDTSNYVGNIGVANISDINNVKCTGSGTNLNTFVCKADSSIKDNSLVVIFTDDDGGSIRAAVDGMKKRTTVFWQIIVYGKHTEIKSTINGIHNISLVCMSDYASKSENEINQVLLKDYIEWKKQ